MMIYFLDEYRNLYNLIVDLTVYYMCNESSDFLYIITYIHTLH